MLVALIDVLGAALDYALLMLREWWLLLGIVVFALAALPLPPFLTRVADALESFASRPWRAALTAAALCLVWSLAVWGVRGSIPPPVMHDDLACYLGAQMFAEGRASYPTHPLWPHFEQFHVLHVPSFASKYPIGNELLLAAALHLTGIALLGSWLAAGAACMGIFWALRAALPARWVFAGACAAAIHPVMVNFSHSYRGGGLAALGGALLFGAVVRLVDKPTARLGAIAGAGLVLLAVTRPYEGVVLAAGCAIALLVHRRRGLLVPAAACLGVTLLGLIPVALHNRAVTGSVTTLPWAEYARQYDPAPQFVWQEPGPIPRYRNEEFRFVYERLYRTKFDRVTAPGGLLAELDRKQYFIRWMLAGDPETRITPFLWPLFLIPFVMLPRVLRDDRNARMAAIVVLVFLFAPFSMFVNLLAHYLAPVTAPVAVLMLLLVRALTLAPRGRWIAVAIAVALLVNAVIVIRWNPGGGEDQPRLEAAAGPGKHLFLVAPGMHGILYNDPDIDAQRVVWARDLGDNAALLAYYRDRQVWRVENDGRRVILSREDGEGPSPVAR
jgi:hypothetical protein